MSTFDLTLLSGEGQDCLHEVVSFVGEDASGSFGLLAHHERYMTVLAFGLARVRLADGTRRFVGLPGGVLSFERGQLTIATRRYLLGDDAGAVGTALAQEVLAEERALAATRSHLRHLESSLLQRLALCEPR